MLVALCLLTLCKVKYYTSPLSCICLDNLKLVLIRTRHQGIVHGIWKWQRDSLLVSIGHRFHNLSYLPRFFSFYSLQLMFKGSSRFPCPSWSHNFYCWMGSFYIKGTFMCTWPWRYLFWDLGFWRQGSDCWRLFYRFDCLQGRHQ